MWASAAAMALGGGFAATSRHDSCSRDSAQKARALRALGGYNRLVIRTSIPALHTSSSSQPRSNLFVAAGRAAVQVITKCMLIHVITLFPASATLLTRPRRSGVPDRSWDGCFLAKQWSTPGFTDRQSRPGPSHSQNLPRSSEGKIS